MTVRWEATLVVVLVLVTQPSQPWVRASPESSYDVIGRDVMTGAEIHGNMRYNGRDDTCTYEEIIQRKREAVKLQLFAKLKIRKLPNNTREDLPRALLDQISEVYKLYRSDRHDYNRQSEADPESIAPKKSIAFPETVTHVSDTMLLYKWSVGIENGGLERAELHIPAELLKYLSAVYVLEGGEISEQNGTPLTNPFPERGGLAITREYRRWAEDPASNNGIIVSCTERCFGEENNTTLMGKKPFISLTIPVTGHQRVKRYGTPTAQSCERFPDHCCFKDHYLTFKELGLDHVVLEPKYFNAGLCLGKCVPMWLEEFYHSHVISHVEKPTNCCAPITLADLEVIIWDAETDDTRLEKIPKMLVTECGCK